MVKIKLHRRGDWQLAAAPTGQSYSERYLPLYKLQLHKISEGLDLEGHGYTLDSLDPIKIEARDGAEPVVGDWSTGRWLLPDLRKLRLVGQ